MGTGLLGKRLPIDFAAKLNGPWRFRLVRVADPTGVSGTGHIADGVQFRDGTCVLRWNTEHSSTAVYASHKELMAIHGHNGGTMCEWVEGEASAAYRRAVADAEQDSFENCPFASIGGLDCRHEPRAPEYVEDPDVADYVAGYIDTARVMYGEDWQTCEFSWAPAMVLGDAKPPPVAPSKGVA